MNIYHGSDEVQAIRYRSSSFSTAAPVTKVYRGSTLIKNFLTEEGLFAFTANDCYLVTLDSSDNVDTVTLFDEDFTGTNSIIHCSAKFTSIVFILSGTSPTTHINREAKAFVKNNLVFGTGGLDHSLLYEFVEFLAYDDLELSLGNTTHHLFIAGDADNNFDFLQQNTNGTSHNPENSFSSFGMQSGDTDATATTAAFNGTDLYIAANGNTQKYIGKVEMDISESRFFNRSIGVFSEQFRTYIAIGTIRTQAPTGALVKWGTVSNAYSGLTFKDGKLFGLTGSMLRKLTVTDNGTNISVTETAGGELGSGISFVDIAQLPAWRPTVEVSEVSATSVPASGGTVTTTVTRQNTAGQNYHLAYAQEGTSVWTVVTMPNETLEITGLPYDTTYNFYLRSCVDKYCRTSSVLIHTTPESQAAFFNSRFTAGTGVELRMTGVTKGTAGSNNSFLFEADDTGAVLHAGNLTMSNPENSETVTFRGMRRRTASNSDMQLRSNGGSWSSWGFNKQKQIFIGIEETPDDISSIRLFKFPVVSKYPLALNTPPESSATGTSQDVGGGFWNLDFLGVDAEDYVAGLKIFVCVADDDSIAIVS